MIAVDRLDHFVLTVKSVEDTCRFYDSVLGIKSFSFGAGSKALCLGEQRIQLQQSGREAEPKASLTVPGSGDFCFVTQTDFDVVLKHLERCNVRVIEGPIRRTGSKGAMTSVYFRDPDLNLIELSSY